MSEESVRLEACKKERRFELVFWCAMVYALLMYFVVALMVPAQASNEEPGLVNLLLGLALGLVAISLWIRARLSARARETGNRAARRMGLIVGLVLCESAALIGIVVWFGLGSPMYKWFLLIGFVGMLLQYPQREEAGQ